MSFEIIANEPLFRHTSFAIGGPARMFISVHDRAELEEAIQYVQSSGESWYILGGGTNVLASDEGFDGILIKNEDRSFSIEGEYIVAAPGAILSVVAVTSAMAGLSGLEWGLGVPGTVGGAVRGNAGAFGGETANVLDYADIVDIKTGDSLRLLSTDLNYEYRRSACADHPEWIIVKVGYRLKRSSSEECKKRLDNYHTLKRVRQPLGTHCAGSMFKNMPLDHVPDTTIFPEEYIRKERIPSGYLIEQVGLKGYREWRAMISDKHANFFINTGSASCEDIMRLIRLTKKRVFEQFGIALQEEIQYIGNVNP